MNQQNKTERWEQDFDSKFPNFRSRTYPKLEYFHSEVNATQIKLFISQLLSDARREEREKRHNWVVKKGLSQYAYCEKCGYMMKYKDNDWDCPGMAKITLRNQALTTAEESIKELK